jgi:hypothetical protein
MAIKVILIFIIIAICLAWFIYDFLFIPEIEGSRVKIAELNMSMINQSQTVQEPIEQGLTVEKPEIIK